MTQTLPTSPPYNLPIPTTCSTRRMAAAHRHISPVTAVAGDNPKLDGGSSTLSFSEGENGDSTLSQPKPDSKLTISHQETAKLPDPEPVKPGLPGSTIAKSINHAP